MHGCQKALLKYHLITFHVSVAGLYNDTWPEELYFSTTEYVVFQENIICLRLSNFSYIQFFFLILL